MLQCEALQVVVGCPRGELGSKGTAAHVPGSQGGRGPQASRQPGCQGGRLQSGQADGQLGPAEGKAAGRGCLHHIAAWKRLAVMPRSNHFEYTRSRPISEVKQSWAGLVLR